MNGVDTNVLVYAVDASEPIKQSQAKQLIGELIKNSSGSIPWQVVGEFLNCLRRWEQQGRIGAADVDGHMSDLLQMFPVVLPTVAIVALAIDLSRQHSLSHWDSMLLAACIDAGIDTLYSEDFSHGVVYKSVKVLNPF